MTLKDFALSRKIIDKDGKHFPNNLEEVIESDVRFMSVNILLGDASSRRDDYIAIFHVLLWLKNDFKLPWDPSDVNDDKSDEEEETEE